MIYQTRFKDTFLLVLGKNLCYKKTFKYPFKSGLTLAQRLAKKIHKLVKLGLHERILELHKFVDWKPWSLYSVGQLFFLKRHNVFDSNFKHEDKLCVFELNDDARRVSVTDQFSLYT